MDGSDSVDFCTVDIASRYPQIDPEVEGVVGRLSAINKHISRTFISRERLVEGARDVLVDRRQAADHALDLRVDLRVTRSDVDGAEIDRVGPIHEPSITSMSSLLTSRDPCYSIFTSRDLTSREGPS